ncbi:hypothetical protein HN51_017794 [Arachis hypogaea]
MLSLKVWYWLSRLKMQLVPKGSVLNLLYFGFACYRLSLFCLLLVFLILLNANLYTWSAGAGLTENFEFMNIIAIVETEADLVVQDFVWKMIELHDKYLAYVNDCFQNHTIFHKILIRDCYGGLICAYKSESFKI